MPALNTTNFDVTKIVFTEAKPNKNGGKYATIGYGDEKNQVEFQLGSVPNELLYCYYGVDNANPNDPNSDLQMKLDLTENSKIFLKKLEEATLAAVEHHSASWFKKKLSKDKIATMYKRLVREDETGARSDQVWVKVFAAGPYAAKVNVIQKKGDKYLKAVPGTFEDVQKGWVVPVVKIKGGVYFMNAGGGFGTSLVATDILVVKEEGSMSGGSAIDLTGVVFHEDADMEDADDNE